jgi:pyruvate/2-oxoglutarate dehydrogenase complex dihydrolipoamide acyltransferase (E2) component
MSVNITMPALSPTMEEGNLAKWLKREGDVIKSGDVIAEIETDKATMEVEAVDEGTLLKIVVPEGTQGVKVNAVIAVIGDAGEKVEAPAFPAGPPHCQGCGRRCFHNFRLRPQGPCCEERCGRRNCRGRC